MRWLSSVSKQIKMTRHGPLDSFVNERGQSLVEGMIVGGLIVTGILALSAMSNATATNRTKLGMATDRLNLANGVRASLNSYDSCSNQVASMATLNTQVGDGEDSYVFPASFALKATADASSPILASSSGRIPDAATDLSTSKISFGKPRYLSANKYLVNFQVSFATPKNGVALGPLNFPLIIQTRSGDPDNAKSVVGCSNSDSLSQACQSIGGTVSGTSCDLSKAVADALNKCSQSGTFMKGTDAAGNPICLPMNKAVPVSFAQLGTYFTPYRVLNCAMDNSLLNMNSGCNRYCGIDATDSLGYHFTGGTASECDGIDNYAQCNCYR